tara:strand:- start:653 stop:1441 length:789 start_codon:yes stop_codon:yes gene_type:complete
VTIAKVKFSTIELLKKKIKSSRLKKRIKSSHIYWVIKLFLKRLIGVEIWVKNDIKILCEGQGPAGWNYYKKNIGKNSIIYVFGVGDDISFELDFIAKNQSKIFAFDPTPYSIEWLKSQEVSDNFIFYPWAVSGKDKMISLYPRLDRSGKKSQDMWTIDESQSDGESSIEVFSYTLKTILKKLKHKKIDILKLDIEGAEYSTIDSMISNRIYPNQILVEFHHRFTSIGKQRTINCIDRLRLLGYQIFSVSQTGREFSFIRKVD